jgi:hypothetical protein
MMLLFVTVGGAALALTGLLGHYQKNRELAAQATYAAEGALHKAVYQMMSSASLSALNTTSLGVQSVTEGYDATMAAIIETTVSPGAEWQGRVYTRGSAGGGRVVKFLRAYLRISSVGFSGTCNLWDWQEITRATVVAHRDSLPDSDPKKAEFTAWL